MWITHWVRTWATCIVWVTWLTLTTWVTWATWAMYEDKYVSFSSLSGGVVCLLAEYLHHWQVALVTAPVRVDMSPSAPTLVPSALHQWHHLCYHPQHFQSHKLLNSRSHNRSHNISHSRFHSRFHNRFHSRFHSRSHSRWYHQYRPHRHHNIHQLLLLHLLVSLECWFPQNGKNKLTDLYRLHI